MLRQDSACVTRCTLLQKRAEIHIARVLVANPQEKRIGFNANPSKSSLFDDATVPSEWQLRSVSACCIKAEIF